MLLSASTVRQLADRIHNQYDRNPYDSSMTSTATGGVPSQWDDADVLSRLLHPLRLRGAYVSDWQLRAGWSVHGAPEPRALIHLLLDGVAAVRLPSGETVDLAAGDLGVFPRGAAHRVGDPAAGRSEPLDALLPARLPGTLETVVVGAGEPVGRLLCAGLDYAPEMEYPLYRTLPDLLVVRAAEIDAHPSLRHAIAALHAEVDRAATAPTTGGGSAAVRLRAFELIFVLALRHSLARCHTPLSHALSDPGIGAALTAMYDDHARPWSVGELAAVAGMSRSAFSRTFKELVGDTPARHLRLRRLDEARRLLQTTGASQEAIARRVGYDSAVGLHLAFKAEYGIAPGDLRTSA